MKVGMNLIELEKEFNREVTNLVKTTIEKVYKPTAFISMAANGGYYQAVKRLLASNDNQEGFTKLLLANHPELTIEMFLYANMEKYRELFTEKELQEVKRRLTSYELI